MKLDEFIKLFDAKAVAEAKVAFTFHAPKTGKWNFWAEDGVTRDELAAHVMKIDELAKLEIDGFQNVSLEPWDENSLRVRVSW